MSSFVATLSRFINDYLDPLGVVLGLLLTIPVFWTWFEVVFGRGRRYRQYLATIRQAPGQRPAILMVDVLAQKNVRAAVENYCQQQEALAGIPAERIFHLQRNGLGVDGLAAFQQELRQLNSEMFMQAVDRIHYFHAGPGMAAAMVGAELANACPVVLYQHAGMGYQPFGVLKLPVQSG